jgi:oligopeptidase B
VKKPQAAPVARKIPAARRLHGRVLKDDYAWLQDKKSAVVIDHLKAENAHTDGVLGPLEPFQEKLYKEMLRRIRETDMGVPYRDGEWIYYSRTVKGRQYPIYCRRFKTMRSPEKVVLDLNSLARGKKFLSLGVYSVSPDGRRLAYSTDVTGFREYTLYVKDLTSGRLLSERLQKVRSISWANDGQTLYYVREDKAKRASRLYRHALGNPKDTLLLAERNQAFSISLSRSRSRRVIFLTSDSTTSSEVHWLDADDPASKLRLITRRQRNLEYYADHHGDHFYILVNDRGPNFRLVAAPMSDPSRRRWSEVIPHDEDVVLEGADLFARHAVVHERRGGFPCMRVVGFESGKSHYIRTPERVCNVYSGANRQFDSHVYRFGYESLVTPDAVYDYDMNTGERKLLKQEKVKGGYDPSRYQTELRYAKAKDGTRIPVSLVYKKDGRKKWPRPLLLTGYGAYGYAHDVYFSSTRLSLLDRGAVYAIAHIRGGGEMGKRWHDAGRLLSKKNTFADFIACAEHLVRSKRTAPGKLVIEGGSAGGLLMGAVTNMRPDLFHAVVAQVPFVDIMNTMLDPTLPLTTGEYEEWGNPNRKEYFRYMLSYSPYDNIRRGSYPAMLVETSLNDSQVMYWEPAKYVAKLRTVSKGDRPLLLKTNLDAGHGGASGRYEYLRELAFTDSFILWQMGLTD